MDDPCLLGDVLSESLAGEAIFISPIGRHKRRERHHVYWRLVVVTRIRDYNPPKPVKSISGCGCLRYSVCHVLPFRIMVVCKREPLSADTDPRGRTKEAGILDPDLAYQNHWAGSIDAQRQGPHSRCTLQFPGATQPSQEAESHIHRLFVTEFLKPLSQKDGPII